MSEFVTGQTREKLSEPWYNPDGDCIVYQMADEGIVARRIDDILTIYNSATSSKTIGFQIKGVAALARKYGWHGIVVECRQAEEEIKEVSLSALLLAAYEQGPKTIGRRSAYADMLDTLSTVPRMRVDDLESLFPKSLT